MNKRKINPKCFECSKVPRDTFVWNRPDCYDFKNCRKKRSYYRDYENNKLKQSKWHKWRQFIETECFICGSRDDLEIHHVHARASDRDDTRGNTVTLCHVCHSVITRFETKLGYGSKKKPRWKIAVETLPPV